MAQVPCEDSSMVLSLLAVRWDPMVTFVQRERQVELMDITSWQKHKGTDGRFLCSSLLLPGELEPVCWYWSDLGSRASVGGLGHLA